MYCLSSGEIKSLMNDMTRMSNLKFLNGRRTKKSRWKEDNVAKAKHVEKRRKGREEAGGPWSRNGHSSPVDTKYIIASRRMTLIRINIANVRYAKIST